MDEISSKSRSSLNSSHEINSPCSVYTEQLAGHGLYDSNYSLLTYDRKDGISTLLKPLNNSPNSLRELAFYEHIKNLPESHPLRTFTAHFFGTAFISTSEGSLRYFIELEDLTPPRPFCSMDVKIGTETYSPDDTFNKKLRILNKYPFQKELAMRICGMKVRNFQLGTIDKRNSDWGKKIRPEMLQSAVSSFFNCGEAVESMNAMANGLVELLEELLCYFRKQTEFLFRSSSLLLSYWESDYGDGLRWSVKMVDFCHVYASDGIDVGYVKGLERLMKEIRMYITGLKVDRI